jgi:hypothetical protein
MTVEQPTSTSINASNRQEVVPTKSGRRRYFPAKFDDFLPSTRTALPHIPNHPREPTPMPISPSPVPSPSLPPPEPCIFQTDPDEFGLYRTYTTFPTTDPEADQTLDDLYDGPPITSSQDTWRKFGAAFNASREARENIYHPFPNATTFRLVNWYYGGSNTKSVAELNSLVHDVLLPEDFSISDLQDFNAARELQRLDVPDETAVFSAEAGWKESSVYLPLAIDEETTKEEEAPRYEVPGVWHRDLVDVLRSALQDQKACSYHFTPHRLWYKPTPDSEPERVMTDLYNSDAFLEEHEKLQHQPKEPGCDLERVIVALMPWSDSTNLTNFGQASLWPIYLFLGNQSKYSRGKPSDFAAHHLAYIPSVCLQTLSY